MQVKRDSKTQTMGMKSVPRRVNAWVWAISDLQLPIANCLVKTPIGNWQSTIGDLDTHALPRCGTDLQPAVGGVTPPEDRVYVLGYDSGSMNYAAKNGRRPRIGITMRLELETDRFYLSRYYSEAVEAAGGAPFHISLIPNPDYISTVMDSLDGVLLPGSDSDVDPLRYGAEPHPNLGSVHTVKDETDLLVLEEIERRALPLFAICFGMQVLNVSRGGTLIQDIGSQFLGAIKHQQGPPRDRPSHAIRLARPSLLESLAENERVVVNSHHHQAVENIGRNLVATAWSSDGLVEALEDTRTDRFALAVQWHPEIGWKDDPFSRALFNRFIAATREAFQDLPLEKEVTTVG